MAGLPFQQPSQTTDDDVPRGTMGFLEHLGELRTRIIRSCIALVLAGASTVALSAQGGQSGAACDRVCLQGIADAYLSALVAHDPSKAPMAANAKFTEQAQPMAIGEGQLWKLTTEGPTTFKIPVADPVVGQINLIAVRRFAPAPRCARIRARLPQSDGFGL